VQRALGHILAVVPPGSGAVVMGTGIVSVALSLDGREILSRVLLAGAAVLWIVLGLLLAGRILCDRERARRESRSPTALAGVAGTAVLGTRLVMLGWSGVAVALLLIALVFWLGLLTPVLTHWVTPTVGVSLLLAVSTESLAVLAATLGDSERRPWLVDAALAPFLLGLVLYLFVILRFDLGQLATGRGDHWITGGALAISTLTAARFTLSARSFHALGGATGTLKVVSLVLWGLSLAWLPALVAAEALWPRLGYDARRWSTVFPVGMYAACSFALRDAVGVGGVGDFARAWVWLAVSIWLVVLAGITRRGADVLRIGRAR